MVRFFLNNNVVKEAMNRIDYIFKEFPNIVVNVSGGKDSTVILDLALKKARELGRLPLKVLFLDQEAEWSYTVDWMRKVMNNPDVEPYWFQMPLRIINATSFKQENKKDYLYCWEEGKEWLRDKEAIAIKENKFNEIDFFPMFAAIFDYYWKDKKTAVIYGVRAEESPVRFLAMTTKLTYKNLSFGRKYKNPNHFNFSPIYDWSYTDVWKYIQENKLNYNKIYDYQYMYGVPIQRMRVSNLHHETAIHSLVYLQEVDKELYEKMIKRMNGIHAYTHFNIDFDMELPYMFHDWLEYRNFLLEKLTPDKHKDVFKAKFKRMDLEFDDNPKFKNILKSQCQCIINNDWDGGTKMKNLYKSLETRETNKAYWTKLEMVKNGTYKKPNQRLV